MFEFLDLLVTDIGRMSYETYLSYIVAEIVKFVGLDPQSLFILLFGFLVGFLLCGLLQMCKTGQKNQIQPREHRWKYPIAMTVDNNLMLRRLTSALLHDPDPDPEIETKASTSIDDLRNEIKKQEYNLENMKQELAEMANQQNRFLNFACNTFENVVHPFQQLFEPCRPYFRDVIFPYQLPWGWGKKTDLNKRTESNTEEHINPMVKMKKQEKSEQSKKIIPQTNFFHNIYGIAVYPFQCLQSYFSSYLPKDKADVLPTEITGETNKLSKLMTSTENTKANFAQIPSEISDETQPMTITSDMENEEIEKTKEDGNKENEKENIPGLKVRKKKKSGKSDSE